MKIGAKIRDTLDEAIRLRDKVVLILSESSVVAAGGDTQQLAHGDDRVARLVIAHESEPFAGIAFVSRANQAAAFERISRSTRSWRFSRRSRWSSSRSAVVRPPSPRPAFRADCATQFLIDCAVGSNSAASDRRLER